MSDELQVSIPQSELSKMQIGLVKSFDEIRQPVQAAMAEKYFEIVRSNFGQFGVDRPVEWSPLSDRSAVGRAYIQKVGRTYATLFVTGKLESSVSFEANDERGRVFADEAVCDYAAENQYGNPSRNLPARPFFPLNTDGSSTQFSQEQVTEAARNELQLLIGGGQLK